LEEVALFFSLDTPMHDADVPAWVWVGEYAGVEWDARAPERLGVDLEFTGHPVLKEGHDDYRG